MAVKITPEKLNELATYLLSGMTEKESCILVNISYAELTKMKERSEEVREFLEKKKVTFKYQHLQEIQKVKSEKNSMWMLEKVLPEEFGNKAKNSGPVTVNIISQIIKEIQNDSEPIIGINRGSIRDAQAEESNKGDSDSRARIAAALG